MSAKQEATIRARKVFVNRLLKRKQMLIDVVHHGRPNVPKKEMQDKLGKIFKADPAQVVVFGFRTKFGGGSSNGFALVYDDITALKQFEPKSRLTRAGLAKKQDMSRKQRKERKNRAKKLRGTEKASAATAGKQPPK